jgi:hypothetical protein
MNPMTLGAPAPELSLADDEETSGNGAEATSPASTDGVPSRKRKRRRRRGERKERSASDVTEERVVPPQADRSPYASPTSASPAPPSAPTSSAAPPAAPPASPAAPPSFFEPSE